MYRPKLDDPAIFDALPEFYKTSLSRERYFWALNTPEKYQINARAYARMVTGIDREIGRFLEALEKAGLADNTIVVYSADNGYHFGNRGLSGNGRISRNRSVSRSSSWIPACQPPNAARSARRRR